MTFTTIECDMRPSLAAQREVVEMVQRTRHAQAALYEADETAWLEETADLVRSDRFDQIDPVTLAEYLTDMARRDRREVYSRLVVLLAHLLKREQQPSGRTGSWEASILEQQRELRQLLESGTLRNHAAAVLADAYTDARKQAAAESGVARGTFPDECPWDLEAALADRGEKE
jgi:hypothetical protein